MLAYISENADKRILDALKQEGFEVKPLAPFDALSYPVDTHADMLLLNIENTLFLHCDYKIQIIGFTNVIKIDEPISKKYPNDILLNIAIVGNHAFCNTKYASKSALEYLTTSGVEIHHVQQGYAHCSTCIVNENSLITADVGIAQAAEKAGVDVLKINEGNISLPPYSYGFIGGSSGVFGNKIYFCGSLKFHPDGKRIREFCESHEKHVIELCDNPLSDVGGILFV